MSYGRCVTCGAPGVTRERRPNGDTVCERGHRWPSASFDRHEQSFIANTQLGITPPGGSFPPFFNIRSKGTGQDFEITVRGDPKIEINGTTSLTTCGKTATMTFTLADIRYLRDHLNSLLNGAPDVAAA